MKSSRKDRLSELKVSQFDGNALNWQEWFGQFTSTIGSARRSADEKLTYLKTLVTRKAKAFIPEYNQSGALYNDAIVLLLGLI